MSFIAIATFGENAWVWYPPVKEVSNLQSLNYILFVALQFVINLYSFTLGVVFIFFFTQACSFLFKMSSEKLTEFHYNGTNL